MRLVDHSVIFFFLSPSIKFQIGITKNVVAYVFFEIDSNFFFIISLFDFSFIRH